MDFIKKNWGLLTITMIGVIAAGAVAFLWLQASSKVSANKKKFMEQAEFFKSVKAFGRKLNEDNKEIAQTNEAEAQKRFRELRLRLANTYRIEPSPKTSPLLCLRKLRSEIKLMGKQMEWSQEEWEKRSGMASAVVMGAGAATAGMGMEGDAGMAGAMGGGDGAAAQTERSRLAKECEYLSFGDIALSPKLPKAADVPEIFRQLKIVQEVVRLIAKSDVDMVQKLERPMALKNLSEDTYQSTPIRFTVVGKAEAVQQLVNAFYTDAKYMFFLRKLAIESQDQAAGGKLSLPGFNTGGGGEGGMGADMRGAAMPGAGNPAMMGGMQEGGEMGFPGGGASALELQEITRDKFVPFKSRTVTANIRLDLIEFLPPAEEEE